MIISRNLTAMNINRIANANISAHSKSTEKVSSGYKINLAVDNPVGMAMSETMRRQIRGLMQATNNTKDGVAFVQIADGAMSEIHDMLQRMNELSIKSLNGTCTASDRAALNAEFDQLRTEIDRINSNTSFNTLPVFEEHEASYYQICGNRQWSDNQLHTITETTNDLTIRLPDSYVPNEYTITVPTGTYTTQELIDEIDDALHKLSPSNPGFVFEYTSDGYCNLNLEKADGGPAKIESVDGSLAYLIYNIETGSSTTTLLGTTNFGTNGVITIYPGRNDQLGFYAETATGSHYILITLSPGMYNQNEMIKHINLQLDRKSTDFPIAANIRAKANGNNIQITGGNTIEITGMKGNMFQYETSAPKYHSIFYDNAIYSNCSSYPASITSSPHVVDLTISDNNNILKFKVNDSKEYEIRLTDPGQTETYSIDKIRDIIQNQLGDDVEATIEGNRLKLTSKVSGSSSKLDFSSYFTNSIYKSTYETLFCTTSGEPYMKQPYDYASLTGGAALDVPISLGKDASFSFYIDNNQYTISGLSEEYTDLKALLNDLNESAKNQSINNKIEFVLSNNHIRILSKSMDVKNITIKDEDRNATYTKLFTGKGLSYTQHFSSSYGYVVTSENQGILDRASIDASITASSLEQNITIDKNTNRLTFTLYHNSPDNITIDLREGTYSVEELTNEIAIKLKEYDHDIRVKCNGNSIEFRYQPTERPADNDTWSIQTGGSIWNAVWKPKLVDSIHWDTPATPVELTSFPYISDSVTINDSNDSLSLKLDIDGKTISVDSIQLDDDVYDREGLRDALEKAINETDLKDRVFVSIVKNKLVLKAYGKNFIAEGKFYDEIMCKGESYNTPSLGSFTYAPDTRIIGRVDLLKESVKIIEEVNDQLTFDFTYPGSTEPLTMTITLPPGDYTNGTALVEELNKTLKDQISKYSEDNEEIGKLFGENGCFNLNFTIGGYQTDAANNVDLSALQISVTQKTGADLPVPATGKYILDGVRGSAAPFVFYKTTSRPTASYIIGTKNVMGGVLIEQGKNVLTLSANSVPYQYTFPENTFYTADELIDQLNSMFKNGDDYGHPAPLIATLENGAVKIMHKAYGANTITNVGGSARSTIFFEEEGRGGRDNLILQVGSEQRSTIELPRMRVNSCSLGINSITISQMKYAEKAVNRIKDAINQLNTKRSTYGAMQNRLEHTINNNENIAESVQKTESIIRDTDISSEMIRYSNLSILLQASQNAIVQSNQRIEKLLTVLQ